MISDISSIKSKCLYSCSLCKKEYTRKGSLDKHLVLCEFKSKSRLELQVAVEEASDKPTYDQLVKIVQELSIKYVKMEEKQNEMQQYIDRKKKKMDVVTWLNINIKPTVGFLEWIAMNITVVPEHFLELLKPEITIFECLQEVFEFNLFKDHFVCPLKCFAQKNGIFYIYEPSPDININSSLWREMELKDFVLLLKQVQKKLIGELSEWRKGNQKLFYDNDRVADQFNKAVIKLMNISFGQDANMSRIKNGLFHYLKTDLDCLI
jgi:signal recognition particle subunit SEC65